MVYFLALLFGSSFGGEDLFAKNHLKDSKLQL